MPSVPAVPAACLQRLTCPRQRAVAPGHQARYPASYTRPPGGGTGPAAALSRCLSAAGLRLLGILSRRGIAPLLRSAYRATISADPDGVSMFRTRETRPGWAPSISRGQRCSRDRPEVGGRRLPLPSGQPLSPPSCHPPRGARINGTSARVHWCSPVQPSPHLWPRDGTGALGLSPEAPHPCGQDPQAHVQGGDKSRTLTRRHVPGITGPPNRRTHSQRATSRRNLGDSLSRSRPPRLGSVSLNLDPTSTRQVRRLRGRRQRVGTNPSSGGFSSRHSQGFAPVDLITENPGQRKTVPHPRFRR